MSINRREVGFHLWEYALALALGQAILGIQEKPWEKWVQTVRYASNNYDRTTGQSIWEKVKEIHKLSKYW